MTNQQIRDSIRSGWPFFGVAANGDVLARYIPFTGFQMASETRQQPTHLQGDDLLWWLQAGDEEDHPG